MKLKPLFLIVVLLAALSVVAYVLQRPPGAASPDPRVGRPVLDPAVLDATARIELTDQGKRVVLAKSGAAWVVSSYYDLPADFAKLSRLIDDLNRATISRLVTREPATLARLGFKDAAITLVDAAGRVVWKLAIGKDAEGGGRFVRYDDEAKGFVANLSAYLDLEPKNWADMQLVNLKADDLAAVAIGLPDGTTVRATRANKDAAWAAANPPAGQRLNLDRLTTLLGSLTRLRFEDTAEPGDAGVAGARPHARTITLTTFGHETITIQLGRVPEAPKPEAQKTEAKAPGAPGIADNTQGSAPAPGGSGPAATGNPEPKTQNPESPPPPRPVYAFITSSNPGAPINALMKRRAYQVFDWIENGLPQKPADLFEPIPGAPPAASSKPSEAGASHSSPEVPKAPAPPR